MDVQKYKASCHSSGLFSFITSRIVYQGKLVEDIISYRFFFLDGHCVWYFLGNVKDVA